MTRVGSLRTVFCGEVAVGKTTMINRLVTGKFSETTRTTVSADTVTTAVKCGDQTVSLEIWDTAGLERYRSSLPSFFKGASVIVAVFDVTRRETFEQLKYWVDFGKSNAPDDVEVLIVGNKCDCQEHKVTKDEACERALGNDTFLVSAKSGEGIHELFYRITQGRMRRETFIDGGIPVIPLKPKGKCCS